MKCIPRLRKSLPHQVREKPTTASSQKPRQLKQKQIRGRSLMSNKIKARNISFSMFCIAKDEKCIRCSFFCHNFENPQHPASVELKNGLTKTVFTLEEEWVHCVPIV